MCPEVFLVVAVWIAISGGGVISIAKGLPRDLSFVTKGSHMLQQLGICVIIGALIMFIITWLSAFM